MPERKLDAYNLGDFGVNVDADDVHTLPQEFRELQNWQVDHQGSRGAIRRRDGMTQLTTGLNGAVAGALALPLPDNSALVRTFLAPINDLNASSNTFRRSTNGTVWANITTGLKAQQQESLGSGAGFGYTFQASMLKWDTLNNRIYYPGEAYSGVGNPTLNVFDGTNGFVLAAIPPNPTTPAQTPIGLLQVLTYSSTQVIFSTYDGAYGLGGGRVFIGNISTGELTQLGPETLLDAPAMGLLVYGNRIWIGTCNITGANASKVYSIRPGDAAWRLEHTTAANNGYCCGLVEFKGNIFAGWGSDAAGNGVIKKRTPDGVWSTTHTSDGTGAGNYCGPFVVSRDKTTLYAYRNSVSGGAAPKCRIMKSTDGSAWTLDYTALDAQSTTGVPILDPNGGSDVYWILKAADGQAANPIILRNVAGVYTTVDAPGTAILRGPMCWLKL